MRGISEALHASRQPVNPLTEFWRLQHRINGTSQRIRKLAQLRVNGPSPRTNVLWMLCPL
jgi:hypothetical protein